MRRVESSKTHGTVSQPAEGSAEKKSRKRNSSLGDLLEDGRSLSLDGESEEGP